MTAFDALPSTLGVEKSLAAMTAFIDRADELIAPYSSPVLNNIHHALRLLATGGKHLRAHLVHIAAAGEPRAHEAAITFGAAVEMLHAAFLIHDDIIDGDDFRRGHGTIHALSRHCFAEHYSVTDPAMATRMGEGMGIVAGDLALTWVYQMLGEACIPAPMKTQATAVVSATSATTIYGEMLDIEHAAYEYLDLERIRLANHLKTSDYSFTAPLHLGCIAAGRDPQPLERIATELGKAYQAADDLLGSLGDSAATGKRGSDMERGRTTLVTSRIRAVALGPDAETDAEVSGPAAASVAADVAAEARAHLAEAVERIESAPLHGDTRDGLKAVARQIETVVSRYA